ncbi:hypothetical protein IWQ61_007158 [Dispira simplex]|nr:hypothetical protein IWQ61_007158 [Dispira simplex]
MNTSTYRILYFPTVGRATASFLMLDYAGATWTPEFITEWPLQREDIPFDRLPVLHEANPQTEEPFVLSESRAIERYLAQTLGLYHPKEEEVETEDASVTSTEAQRLIKQTEALQEAYVSQWEDVVDACLVLVFDSETHKEEKIARMKRRVRQLLEKHGSILDKNPFSQAFYFGDQPVWVDFAAYAGWQCLKLTGFADEFLEQAQPVLKLVQALENLPRFAACVAKEAERAKSYGF